MATLPRPGVEISQEIIVESPTILTPSLVPCLVGPCFQIVNPLAEDGSLNSEAQSSIAAVLQSNSALGDLLNLSGRSMVLNINGNGEQTIQFPVTIDNASLSRALVENTINKQLSGAVAKFIDDKLTIMTSAKGPTASIKVIAVASDSAYGSGADDIVAMNYMEGETVSGKTSYTNTLYTIPFSSFPSPKTDVSEVVIDKDAVAVYVYYDSKLSQLSDDSAIAMNSYHCGSTQWGGSNVSLAHQPALSAGSGSGRVSLYGRQFSGSKTNTLVHPGTEASLTLPLCHDVAPDGTPLVTWPDATGGNSLTVNCIGKSNYFSTNNAEDLGLVSGIDGNALYVKIVDDLSGIDQCSATYAASKLTITGSSATKFGTLAAALADATLVAAIDGIIEVELSQAAEDDSVCDFSQFTGDYYLGGGSDPVDFSADAGSDEDGNDLSKAYICGATIVGASTADALGIGGETLSISVDGGEATAIELVAADPVIDSINTAMGYTCAASVTAKNELGETLTGLLQLSTETTDGQDSTIEISASSARVIEILFSGSVSGSESIPASSVYDAALGAGKKDRAFALIGGTEYNASASSAMMQAIQPSSMSLEISGVQAMAGVFLDAQVLADDGDKVLSIKIDGAAAAPITITTGACDSVDNTVDHLNTQLGATTLAVMRSSTGLLLYNTGGVGTSIELDSAGTAAELQTQWPGVYDSAATSELVSMNVADSGHGGALEVLSVSNSMAHVVTSEDATVLDDLTAWCINSDESIVEWSSGRVFISFSFDAEGVVGSEGAATLKVIEDGTAASISYSRVWANNTQASKPVYTGRVFQGMANKLAISDSVLNNGSMLGRIVGIEGFSVGASSHAGATIVISEYAVDNKNFVDDWYVKAENLVDGDGRVSPEITASNLAENVAIKHGLLRNRAGLPMSNDSAPVYLGYQALRKDVSADTANPQLLVFNSISEVETFIGPIDPANPLAFGMYMAFLNSTNINISALGVSEISADAPSGTLEAYAEALDFLELKEVYALAPLTDDLSVFQKFSQHVTDMSAATAKKERMVICCPSLPTEESPTLVESGSMVLSPPEGIGGGKFNVSLNLQSEIDQKTLHLAINGKTDANGDTIVAAEGSSYTPSQGIYLDRAGDANRYLIVGTPDASTVTIETSDVYHPGLSGPGTGGNGDSFYKKGTDAISALSDWEADGEQCTIFIRQPALDSKTTGGRLKICEGLAEIAGGVTGFQNRRVVLVQPEKVGIEFGGMEISQAGHYLCGAIAAMIAQQSPSQPFTNLPMVGFTRPIGSSDKFSDNQMSTAAGGGIYWVIQDVEGGALASRHQLTTDVSSLKTRELSILKSVDYVAKLIRGQIKRFIGRRNITKQLLETVSLGIGGALNSVSGSVVASATLDSIAQDPANPDTITLDVSITPYYPANKIRVTIYV